jgi:HSP20 family protein
MTMAWKDLIPWRVNRSASAMSSRFREKADASLALHQQMNRLLDNVTRNFGSGFGCPTHFGWPEILPNFEVSENDKELAVVAELPGFEENDVEVWVHDRGLTLKGDKKEQKDDEGSLLSSRRTRKQSRRWLKLRSDVEPNQVKTSFKDGVLTVTLAKRVHR